MTDLNLEHDPAPTESTDEFNHFVCCLVNPGDNTTTLCGQPDTCDETVADTVACVVCNDLAANDWCPQPPAHRCILRKWAT